MYIIMLYCIFKIDGLQVIALLWDIMIAKIT